MINDGEPRKKCKRDEFFVDISLAKSAEVDKDWIQSDREHHLRTFEKIKQNVTYEELLTSNDRFCLIRGIAGIGKTSLLDCLMLKWASGKLWHGKDNQPHFDFVFRFNCRELNLYEENCLCVEDLFKCHYPDIFDHICFKDLRKNAERILIILDGLDEFRDIDRLLVKQRILGSMKAPTATVIQTLLSGCLPNCKRIVAGRPESVNMLYSRWGANIEIKCADIVGFSDKMIHKYIFQFSSNAKVVKQKVEEFYHLKAMSHIPVYLWIICSIFEEDMMFPAPRTMTELYIWAFAVFIREHCRKQQFSSKSMSLVKLLQEDKTKEILIVASHLSYRMIKNRKVIFTQADIEQLGYCGSVFLQESTGFVVEAMRNAVEEPIYQFRHLILQEFLCAVYCFTNDILLSKELLSIGSFHIVAPIISGLQGAMVKNSQSPMVIKYFVKQLCGKKGRSSLMIEDLLKLMPKDFCCDKLFHCFISSLYEFQNVMTKRLKEMLRKKLSEKWNLHLSIHHCHSFDYFIHFILNLHPTQTNQTNLFNRDWLWSFAISNFEIKDHQLVFLSKMITELSMIDIENAKIEGKQGLAELAKAIVKASGEVEQKGKCIDLQKLNLSNCNITAEKLAALSPALPFIKEVDLSDNSLMEEQGYAELAKTIFKASGEAEQKGKCIDLQKLNLLNCNITAEELSALSPALPFIKEVDLSDNSLMEEQGYAVLAKTIFKASGEAEQKRKCIDLQKLNLSNCNITGEGLAALSPALPFIKEVDLSDNSLMEEPGYAVLAKTIFKASGEAEQKGKCIDLQKLNLFNCNINAEELAALSPALPFIKEVDLSDNSLMEEQGYAELAKTIFKASGEAEQKGKCIDLQKLSLTRCSITAEKLAALSPALPFIKEVDLSDNSLMEERGNSDLAKTIFKASGEAEQKGKCIDLQKLNLSNCNITGEGLAALSPAFPFIKEVDLSDNCLMEEQGYAELAKIIFKASGEAEQKGKCIDLQKLNLLNCNINAEELAALSPALPFLKEVDLSDNILMEEQGYAELAKTVFKASGEAERKGKCINLQKLRLKVCDITAEELAALSPALPFIKEVDLSNNWQMGEQGYAELAKTIFKASREAEQKGKCIDLQKLNLWNCHITPERLAALSAALPFIKEVDLSDNSPMEERGYAELAKTIFKASGEAEQKGKCIDLQKLNLSNCDITAERLTALSPALLFIKEVDLSDNYLMGEQGYAELTKTIFKASREAEQKGKCIDLQKLSLTRCFITAEKLAALSPALPFIKEVDLSDNSPIEERGYAKLAKTIFKASGEAEQKRKCIDLQKLNLSNCNITAERLAALSPALLSIKEVDLSDNCLMGEQGYAELAKTIFKASREAEQKGKCIDLQKLNLSNCNITGEKLAALSPALPFIKEVDLSDNSLMEEQGYAELAKTIFKASGEAEQKGKCIDLQKLNLSNCNITGEKLAALSPALPFIKEVDLSDNSLMEERGYAELAKTIFKASGEAEQKGKCIDLQKLNLSNCNITGEKLAALSPALPFIKEVDLSDNSLMEEQGYAELAKTIFKASREAEQKGKCIDLQKLHLRNCYITAEILAALSPVLSFIKEVDILTNPRMVTQGYAELGKTIFKANLDAEQKGKCIDLQKLSLTNCYITAEKLAAVSPPISFIKEADLSYNMQMGEQGYADLSETIV